MKDLAELMKQAGAMQAKLASAQEAIAALEVEGHSGGGMVKIIINGKGYVKAVAIERALLKPEEGEVVEDLIAAALNDAKAKLDIRAAEEMKALTAGLPLPPGMKLPF
ncbi:MAG TPA: YbaB/EbfC family nucleoid-associated protein [Parvularcula sp.]|nr:YbaB/EbfC family nucleoid-associated protein [Parvularcula sp.]HBS36643.1 YbaB/EbfC family nucleoid-associated protein [Parvularcula sp.]